ncbi:MAG: hypothetical protein KKF65_03900 [Nanoarchaeota archaeon]|nr:hypothetical protein [Nanoarchaeota archaeon]
MSEKEIIVNDEKENKENLVKWEEAIENGLTEEEVIMGVNHNLISDEGIEEVLKETEEETTDETDKNAEKKDESDSEQPKSINTKQQPEKENKSIDKDLETIKEKVLNNDDLTIEEEKRVHELSKEEKGFYFRTKKEIAKRQAIQKEKEFYQLQAKAKDERLKKYEEELKSLKPNEEINDDDYITAGQLKKIESSKELDREEEKINLELQQKQHEARIELIRVVDAEQVIKDTNYHKVIDKFKEISQGNPEIFKNYSQRFNQIGVVEEAEYDLLDYVYRIVNRHGGIETTPSQTNEEKINTAKKVFKNASKPVSSASISASGIKTKLPSEYELEDILNMSEEDYSRLSPEIRKKLLQL